MPALCDVNVLLALTTDRHAFHTTAVRWLDGVSAGGAVICRVAQTGLLRLLNNPAVMREDVLDATACWEIWRRLLEDERISFTPTEPPSLDAAFERFTSGECLLPDCGRTPIFPPMPRRVDSHWSLSIGVSPVRWLDLPGA